MGQSATPKQAGAIRLVLDVPNPEGVHPKLMCDDVGDALEAAGFRGFVLEADERAPHSSDCDCLICDPDENVLGCCPHGVNLDREFCPDGCRV